MKPLPAICRFGAVLVVSAISFGQSGGPSGPPVSVEYGTVMETFPFSVNHYYAGRSAGMGAEIGEMVGVVAASAHWGLRCYTPEMAIGAVAGRAMGMMMENAINAERLQRIHILLDDGRETVVTQPIGKRKFKSDDKVKVLRYDAKTQIVYPKDEYVELEENPYVEKGIPSSQSLERLKP